MSLKQLFITLVLLVFTHTGFSMYNSSCSELNGTFLVCQLINEAEEENEMNWEMPENRDLDGHSCQSSHPFEFNTPCSKTALLQISFQELISLGNRNKQFHLSVVIGNCSPPPDFN